MSRRRPKKRFVSRTQSVLNEWRRVDAPPEGIQPARAMTDLIPEALEGLRVRNAFTEEEICAAWSEIVGSVLAPHTRPSGLKRGVLHVLVVQPTIHYSINGMKPTLLKRLQDRFGSTRVQDIRFQVGG